MSKQFLGDVMDGALMDGAPMEGVPKTKGELKKGTGRLVRSSFLRK